MSNLVVKTDVVPVVREWRSEPKGRYDRPVDIWYNQNWVPAFFSDIKKGDFFLDSAVASGEGRCFLAKSDCMQSCWIGDWSFVISGMEIVQAPAKDITLSLEAADDITYKLAP